MQANPEEVIGYRRKMRKLRKVHLILCTVATVLSWYSLYVELNLEKDKNYTALCDIGPGISCSKVFGSKWGKGFGVIGDIFGEQFLLNQPNGLFGMISYPIFIFTSRFENYFLAKIMLAIGVAGMILTTHLAYVLFYILDDICVVCLGIYAINLILFFISAFYFYYTKNLLEILRRTTTPKDHKVEVKKYV